MKKIFLLLTIIMFSLTVCVYSDGISDFWNEKTKKEVEKSFDLINSEYDAVEIIDKLINGDFNIKYDNIFDYLKEKIKNSVYSGLSFYLKLFVVIMIASFIEILQTDTFIKNTSKILCTAMIVISISDVFYNISSYATEIIDKLVIFINSLLPVMMSLLAFSGKSITVGAISPLMSGISSVVSIFLKSFVLPLSFIGLALRLTDTITQRKVLSELGKQIFTIIKWILGLIMTAYISLISVIGASAPKVDNITIKSAKFAVGNFIPYVGGILSDSVDLMFTCSGVIKNSVGIAGLIGILSIIAVPLIKIFTNGMIINLISALTSPIADKEISNAFSSVADSINIIIAVMAVISFMYILSVSVIIFIGST